jgi:hypothetical protein
MAAQYGHSASTRLDVAEQARGIVNPRTER